MYVRFIRVPGNERDIIKCPGDMYAIYVYYTSDDMRVVMGTKINDKCVLVMKFSDPNTSEKHIVDGLSYNIIYDLNKFLQGRQDYLDEKLWQFFYNTLGFVPFYEKCKNKFVYQPGPEYHSIQEIYDRQRPTIYRRFMNIQVPVALLKEMNTLVGIQESIGEFPETVVFPPHLEPHVNGAITNLCGNNHQFTFNEMLVYDFLGITHIFGGDGCMLIDGDVLVECNPINLLSIGIFPKSYDYMGSLVYHYNIKDRIKNGEITNTADVPDTILEVCTPYTKLVNMVEADGELVLKSMKLLLTRRGYI